MPAPRVYVYYRIDARDREACVAAVRALQAGWCARWPGLAVELLQRPDADEAGRLTLMEVYGRDDVDTLHAAIEAEAAARLAPWLRGERHVERFVPCA